MHNFKLAKTRTGITAVIDVDKILYVETGHLKQDDPFIQYGEFVLWVYFFSGKSGYVVEYFKTKKERQDRITYLTGVEFKDEG